MNITDRDICMAGMIKDRVLGVTSVEEVITGEVFSAQPEEDIHKALETMKEHKIRRLPVIDEEGELKGILSMNDIVLKAKEAAGKKPPQLGYEDVVTTYKAICGHPLPAVAVAVSAAG